MENGVWGEIEIDEEGVSFVWVVDEVDIGGNEEMGIGEVGDIWVR